MDKPKIMIIDGNDGAGKTSTIEAVREILAENYHLKSSRIPFNMSQITSSSINIGKKKKYNIITNTFLHLASLADQMEINNQEKNCDIIFIDRYIYSIMGRGIAHGFDCSSMIGDWEKYFNRPVDEIYFDIEANIALSRRKQIGARDITFWEAGLDVVKVKKDIDQNFVIYQNQVRNATLKILPNYVYKIDASQDLKKRTEILLERTLRLSQ